jgi:mycothiol system anti-sigma-R factor
LFETTCEEVLKDIETYLDGELGPGGAARVAGHLSQCRPCFDRAEFQRRLHQLVGIKCRTESPAHLWRRVRLMLEEEAEMPDRAGP